MKSLKPIVAAFLLAIFSLASSHALLESFELIHQDGDHHHASSPSSHDAADGVCRVDSYRVQAQRSLADLQIGLSKVFALTFYSLAQASHECGIEIGVTGSPPLEFKTTWQFSSRMALPARAPSLS